jgi:LPS sulfotransferase NodH
LPFPASSATMQIMYELRANQLVWIFGTGRSGSTWLASMMGDMAGGRLWNEPLVGKLFGDFHSGARPKSLRSKNFVMADAHTQAWLEGIRLFVSRVADSRFPGAEEGEWIVVKEPNGSVGAPYLAAAFPRSALVLLIRDPRDVAASAMDRHRPGGGAYEWRKSEGSVRDRADRDPDAFIEGQAKRYMRNVGAAKRAYEAHEGPKVMVRYEDLRADTLGTMRRVYSTLGIPTEEELARVVRKHAWENISEEKKGRGKFHRKAKPGGWREDLSAHQARSVEQITAPLLREFYGGESDC